MSDENTQKSIPTWFLVLFQILVVILSMAIGFFGRQLIARQRGDLPLLQQARMIVLNNTIVEVPGDPALEYGMITGMLAVLNDPFASFVEPAVHEIFTDELAGRYAGIGVRLERDTRADWRVYPLPDSPALEAGIQEADLLVAVDDLQVTSATDEVILLAAIRGPEEETVMISVIRAGVQLTFTIQRQTVPLPSITSQRLPEEPRIGLLRVNRIAETTAHEMQTSIDALLDQGIQALIIDLRDNGGGLVDAGVDVARLFLASGEIIQQTSRDKSGRTFSVESPGPYLDLPLVLLINVNTASSAEIVAGALQAQQRATLVGTASFGKTSIQSIFELADGSSVRLTSGAWSIPGVSFPLTPEIEVLDDPLGVEILRSAMDVFNLHKQESE